MSGYTPGPWWTDGQYDGREMGCAILAAHTDRGPLPGNPTRGMVAFATELVNTQARRCEANARLIAAAPDLLEALKGMMPALDQPFDAVAACEQAEAAIAKAEAPHAAGPRPASASDE